MTALALAVATVGFTIFSTVFPVFTAFFAAFDPGLFTFTYLSPTTRDGVVILTNGENGRKLVPTILRDLNAPAALTEALSAGFK